MTRFRWILVCTLLALASAARGAPPADIDAYVKRAMQRFEVPGMAVAIVEDGKTTLAKGYGIRKLGGSQSVDEHTAFAIGSCGKAFTTAALAILVDEGKLAWDDKVTDRLAGFRMYDDHATAQMTTRDLLIHTSGLGLGAGDMLFYPPTDFTRQEVVERLRHIRPTTSFRSTYAYDNVLYIAAGRMIEQISGQPWESFIQQRIFEPLGMRDSVPAPDRLRSDNFGWPHARIDGQMRGMGSVTPLAVSDEMKRPDVAAPAGGILASAVDMGRWLQVQMDQGAIAGTDRRLFSAAAAQEMWTPRAVQPAEPVPAPIALTAPIIETYALGWDVRDYRGHKLVAHSGATDGALAAVALLPAQRVAIAVMINSEDGGARWAVYHRLLDHYLGASSPDWIEAYAQVRSQRIEKALQTLQTKTPDIRPGTSKPPLPAATYAGVYRDAWYGTISITTNADKLRIRFDRTPGMVGALQHIKHNTFRAHWDDRGIEDAYVTFSLDHEGAIDQVTMKAISPLADFSIDYHDLLFRPVREH